MTQTVAIIIAATSSLLACVSILVAFGSLRRVATLELSRMQGGVVDGDVQSSKVVAGRPLPDLALVDRKGQRETLLRRLSGHWGLIGVFSEACPKCLEDRPQFSAAADAMANRAKFVAVSMEGVAEAELLVAENSTSVSEVLELVAIPAYLVVGPDGRLALSTTSFASALDLLRAHAATSLESDISS